MPLAGRTPDAVRAVAEIGGLVASAGADIAGRVADLPGGLDALGPSGGRIPVEAFSFLARGVSDARTKLEAAQMLSERLPDSALIGPVARARDLIRNRLDEALRAVGAADAMLRALPAFAGQGAPRRYFVAVQNPAELRGTGGFIGSYSILTLRDGAISLAPFQDVASLPNLPVKEAPPTSKEFAAIYDVFGGAGFWRNINLTPDAPTAASLIESLYRRVRGVRLDGTVFVDPQALADLLEATGPIAEHSLGQTLDAGSFVGYVTNGTYFLPGDPASRKRILGLAAHQVLERFLAGTDPVAAIRALAVAATDGDLILHAADRSLQRDFERAGIAGELGTPGGDFLGVFASNSAANKVDFYVRRTLTYTVSLGADGTGSALATVRLANGAPAGAGPNEALGPYPGTGLRPGDDLSILSVYCSRGCLLSSSTQDGSPAGVEPHVELGYPAFFSFLRTDAHDAHTLGYSFQIPHAWQGDELGGTYRLRLQGQPTIQPTVATVVVRAPAGMAIVDTNVPMEISGAEATWRGTLSARRDLVVRFQRPFPGRVWTEVWRFLSKPVIRL